MSGDKTLKNLRKRAEEALRQKEQYLGESFSGLDLAQLLEELSIHQEELEMQNEELRQSQSLLEQERKKYADLYEYAPIPYLTLDRIGRIITKNHAALSFFDQSLGYKPTKLIYDYLPKSAKPLFRETIRNLFLEQLPQALRFNFLIGDDLLATKVHFSIYRDDSIGSPVCRVAITNIAKEQDEFDEKLEENQQYFKQVWENSVDGMALSDEQGIVINANKAYEEIYGWTIEELVGQKFSKIFPIEKQKEAEEDYQKIFRSHEPTRKYEAEVQRKDGTLRVVESHIGFIQQNGERVAMLSTIRDITEKRNAKLALKASEEKFRSFVENANDIVYSLNPEGFFTYVSPNWKDILGHQSEEVVDKHFREFVHVDDLQRCIAYFEKVVKLKEKPGGIEYRVYHANGEVRWHASNSSPVLDNEGNTLLYMGIARDISRRKAIEKSLEESEERYKLLSGLTFEGIALHSKGHLIDVNESFLRMFGYKREDLIGRNVIPILFAPEDIERIKENITKNYAQPYEATGIKKDGNHFPVELEARVFYHEGRRIRVTAVRDITQRRKAQIALKESEIRLKLAIENAEVGLWDWNIQTGYVYFNAMWLQMLGYVRTDLESHIDSWEKLIHPDDEKQVHESLQKHLDGISSFYECVHRLKAKSGTWKWVINKGKVIEFTKDGQPLRAIGTHVDITSQKKTEAELRSANAGKDRFFSIISHDLKSPINQLISLSEIIKDALDEGDLEEVKKFVIILYNSAKRATNLLENLLDWSRTQTGRIPFQPKPIVLKKIFHESLLLFEGAAKEKDIELEIKDNTNLTVYADVHMLSAVLRNLIGNALKFSLPNGLITVKATEHTKGWVKIIIADTGIGMIPEHLEKLFRLDVHHTTTGTANEKGTGLGLILCKEFVEIHGGRIWVESKRDKGSQFMFTLPSHQTKKSK